MARRAKSRTLSADERALWRRVAKGFQPLDAERLARLDDPTPPKAVSGAASNAKPIPQAQPIKSGAAHRDAGPPQRTPADRSGDKKLRRGRVEIEARIDLHGLTRAKARRELLAFLHRAQNKGFAKVLVITGKGAGARALDRRRFEPWDAEAPSLPGIIRRSFTQWMSDPDFASLVAGYAEAHRRHGGSGAFYVMVRG